MRLTTCLTIIVVGTFAIGLSASAEETKGKVVNKKPKQETAQTEKSDEAGSAVIRTHENLDVTPEEKKRAAAAKQAATAEEMTILSRVRGLQALMEKEEKLLAQRMMYAAKIREKGLAANDQKILDQAEDYERRALAYYVKRIEQFEKMNVASGTSSTNATKSNQPTRRPTPPSTRSSSSKTGRRR